MTGNYSTNLSAQQLYVFKMLLMMLSPLREPFLEISNHFFFDTHDVLWPLLSQFVLPWL